MSEFAKDTGLHVLQKPKPHEEFHVHIQASVLSAISHHVLCDYVNESMGLFGGTVDEDHRTIYIEHFYACHRETEQLRPDAVEISDMQVFQSSAEFDKHGMKTLGWYHSHPRIKPMPSTKDLNTQLQVQSNIPYAIGIIAGIYSPNTNFGSSTKKYARPSESKHFSISNSYFSFFRAVEEGGVKAGVAVSVTIHRSPVWAPYILDGMCRALSVVLAENQECHVRRLAACRSDEERVLESSSYARVLSLFRISSLFPLKRLVEEQNRQLKWSLAACVGAASSKSVLSTAPIALPSSIIELRWGGSRPAHALNASARSPASHPSPTFPADDAGDDTLGAKAVSSGARRKRTVSSDESSQERAKSMFEPSDQVRACDRALQAAHAAKSAVEAEIFGRETEAHAAEQTSFSSGTGGKQASHAQGGASLPQQQQQQQQQNTRRQSSAKLPDHVVLLDD